MYYNIFIFVFINLCGEQYPVVLDIFFATVLKRLDTNKILRYITEPTLRTQRERDVSGNCVSFPPCYVLWIELAILGSGISRVSNTS